MTIPNWHNHIQNAEFEKNHTRNAPTFANINLFGQCNVDCYFCLGKDLNDEFKRYNQLNVHFSQWENFGRFVIDCNFAGIKNLYVTGQNADSLQYKYLDELVDFLQNKCGFDVGLRTNGYLAPKMMPVIKQCRRSVGYSIHSLDPESNFKIMMRRDIPDWDTIIPATPNCRVSIVLNRYNYGEYFDLLKYIAKFPNVKYIQTRRICTDKRESFLLEDAQLYEKLFEQVKAEYPVDHYFYAAECFNIFGKEVVFWRTVKTTIDSFNYYTDGTINRGYFVIEGYMRDSETYPRQDGVPIDTPALEGYWRKNKSLSLPVLA